MRTRRRNSWRTCVGDVRLEALEPCLVAPVRAVEVSAGRRRAQLETSDDRAGRWMAPQRRDQRAHGTGLEEGVRVREDHHVTASLRHEIVDDAGLPPALG